MSSPANEDHMVRFGFWLAIITVVVGIMGLVSWLSSNSVVLRPTTYSCPPGHVMMHAGGAHAKGYVCLLGLPATQNQEP